MPQAQPFDGKERLGRVTIERFHSAIRLRWTLNKKTYSLTIGKESKDTLKAARAKAQIIDGDITFERFDTTLVGYGKPRRLEANSDPCLRQLWDEFLEDKLPHLKAKTQEEYYKLTALLNKLGGNLSYNSLDTKNALLSITTTDQTRRVLQYLSATCNWGIKHHKLKIENPFSKMASEIPKRKSSVDPSPNAFTLEEREIIIAAFKSYAPSDMCPSYAAIVEFWFLTGCRPSEAIGLTWNKVSEDFSKITFNGSIQTLSNGSQVWSEGSKNNRSRVIATSSRVQILLESIQPKDINPNALLFPSPTGKPINYTNFSKRIWKKIVDPIKPKTTPYNCRDTFITSQLIKGVPSAVISKWCDTSIQMIDKVYADKLQLSKLAPID